MKVTRAYKLKIYGNKTKLDTIRYTANRFNLYVNYFASRLLFNGCKSMSTKNMGNLANQAKHKARGIIKTLIEAAKVTGNKINIPEIKNADCPAKIENSKNSKFDYWISISNQWTKTKTIKIPAKSYSILNKKLQDGWKLSEHCEVKIKGDNVYVIVYVSKNIPKAKPKKEVIGVDVGIKHSVVTSEGHKGRGLSGVIKKQKNRQAERKRQKHKISNKVKTEIKQILDREAKYLIGRSKKTCRSLVVENPKVVGNLCRNNLHGWASAYFSTRCQVLGQENSVLVWGVSPYNTSITCSKCGVVNKESRVNQSKFICSSCKSEFNADVNAALNIALKGTSSIQKYAIRTG